MDQTDTSTPKLALSDDNKSKLQKLWGRKRLSRTYNIVAGAAMAGLATALAVAPEPFMHVLQALGDPATENFVENPTTSQTLVNMGLWGFVTGMLTVGMMGNIIRKTQSIVSEFNTSMHDRFQTQQNTLLRHQQENFVSNLNEKLSSGSTATEEDLEVLSLCDDDLQQKASKDISFAAAKKSDISKIGSFSDIMTEERQTICNAHSVKMDDKSNSLWFLPTLITFTSPLLVWASDRTMNVPKTEQDAMMPAPAAPNLYYLAKQVKAKAPTPSV